MTPSGGAHLNPRTKRREGAESLRNAILRLVRDVWKFGLRESLGWAATGRLAWVPRTLTPSPHPAFPLHSQPNLCCPLGIEWPPFCPRGPSVLVSRGNCAKALNSSAKPQEACKQVRMRDREGPGPLGQRQSWLRAVLPPVKTRWGISQPLLRLSLGRTGSDPEGRKLEKQGKGCR